MAKKSKFDRTCSFCGREIPYNQFIIGGLDAMICSDCLNTAMEIYRDHQTQADREALSEIKIKLLKPKEIKAKLDDYVIGQEEAKKVLSVDSKGKVTVLKGTAAGTYKIKVVAKGNDYYKKKTTTVKVVVK